MRQPKRSEYGGSDGLWVLLFVVVVMLALTAKGWVPYVSNIVNRSQCMGYCESFASQTSPMDCVDKCMSRYEE